MAKYKNLLLVCYNISNIFHDGYQRHATKQTYIDMPAAMNTSRKELHVHNNILLVIWHQEVWHKLSFQPPET